MESQYVTRNPLVGKVSYKKVILLSVSGRATPQPSNGEDSFEIARGEQKHPAKTRLRWMLLASNQRDTHALLMITAIQTDIYTTHHPGLG
jgi:hypothetical protein